MTVYAPVVFEKLIMMDNKILQIERSLELGLNRECINKATGNDGGKSGEFFFFSYDNKLLIKTLPANEHLTFQKFIKRYYLYLSKNPQSLIAKIYGVYKFEFDKADDA